MRAPLLVLLLAVAGTSAPAAAADGSRLDAVQKSGVLRVCTPGDYKPFSVVKVGGIEGLDVDLVQGMAKSLGVRAEFVRTSWPKLMVDFVEKCDIAVGGISVSTDRQKRAFFTTPYMVNGKAPTTKCENAAKFQTVADSRRADVMISESLETITQQKLRPALCAVNPDKPLQYGEMAYLLPRGDVVFKAWIDQWLHLAKPSGDYDRMLAAWTK